MQTHPGTSPYHVTTNCPYKAVKIMTGCRQRIANIRKTRFKNQRMFNDPPALKYMHRCESFPNLYL